MPPQALVDLLLYTKLFFTRTSILLQYTRTLVKSLNSIINFKKFNIMQRKRTKRYQQNRKVFQKQLLQINLPRSCNFSPNRERNYVIGQKGNAGTRGKKRVAKGGRPRQWELEMQSGLAHKSPVKRQCSITDTSERSALCSVTLWAVSPTPVLQFFFIYNNYIFNNKSDDVPYDTNNAQ
jgi:hypothetical protein